VRLLPVCKPLLVEKQRDAPVSPIAATICSNSHLHSSRTCVARWYLRTIWSPSPPIRTYRGTAEGPSRYRACATHFSSCEWFMTLNVKNSDKDAAPSSPGVSAPKSPPEAPARPKPVALEIPVTVNGARTVEGSDKREPFSEKSATVLVFGHGAVIRISALLAPGQLVFLTNEKSKKEVVCQVVKSKTDGNAVGYVELRFTEPAPGFWGMRFPSDTLLPQAVARPAAPAPGAPKVASLVPQVPAPAVAVAPPAPPKPVIAATPAAAAPVSRINGVSDSSSTPAPSLVSTPPSAESKVSFPTPPPPTPFKTASDSGHTEPVAPPPAVLEAPPAPFASAPAAPVVESKPAAPITSTSAVSSSVPSTEELKQQAARLQEQLSSLLFTETPKPAAPLVASPASEKDNVNTPEVAQKVFELASAPSEPALAKPVASITPPTTPAVTSLQVEEIKIPSWLAPLAREAETPVATATPFHVDGTNSDVESVIPQPTEEQVLSEVQEVSRRPETAVFGGQLLGESSKTEEVSSSKSKAGLFIGIAASLLLVAGGAWYSRQPGNALSAMLSGNAAPTQHSASAPTVSETPSQPTPAVTPAVSMPAPAASRTNTVVEPAPSNYATVERATRSASSLAVSAPRTVKPAVEEAKKPSLGDVHLATPVINHEGSGATSSSAPTLDLNSSAASAAPIASLAGSHRAGPAAPVPVGGDVKPAQLLKSVPPEYPPMARNQRISGNVQIDALIDADGNVGAMKVLSGPPLLHQAALNALKQWKYKAAELDGKPTSMHLTVTIQFRTQ